MSDGFSINTMFSKIADTIQTRGTDLNNKMSALDGETLSDQDMLQLQFQVNMYNTLLETASTISKSLTDEAKQLAQRAS